MLSSSQQITILPFLYQTRTLSFGLSTTTRCAVKRSIAGSPRCFSSTKGCQASDKQLEPDAESQHHDGDERRSFLSRWSSASRGDAPYRKERPQSLSNIQRRAQESGLRRDVYRSPSSSQQLVQSQESKTLKYTMTASERNVFDLILTDISKKEVEKDDARARAEVELEFLEADEPPEEVAVNSKTQPGDPRAQLAAIFNTDIEERTQRKKSSSNKNSVTQAPEFAIEDFRVISQQRAISDHRHHIDSLLDAANTDVEIWAVLEKEVFALMRQLNAQTKIEEGKREVELGTQEKAEESALINEHNSEPVNAVVDDDDKKDDTNSDAFKGDLPPPTPSPTSLTKDLNSSDLLPLLESNYAHHCLHALRIFRDLDLPSPYTLHILPQIKALGPISLVLGGTIDLYNEILFQKWDQFSDVAATADHLEDMINQGIPPNVTTIEFLRFLDRGRRADLQGEGRGGKRAWWQMRHVREGWSRVKALYERFVAELDQAGFVGSEGVEAGQGD